MLLGMSRGHFWAFCLGRRRGCGKTGMGHEGKLLVRPCDTRSHVFSGYAIGGPLMVA